jgi:transposase
MYYKRANRSSEAAMGREIRAEYDQILMFPPSVEEWVEQDHPARFIRDFVEALDLKELGFRIPSSEVGGRFYAPDLLLKVWLYGYLNRIRSSRNLERACREHMGLIWLAGRNAPDHNSLWRFLDCNREAIAQLFKQSVKVAVKCDLVGMAVHAVDGTKIKSKSSWWKMVRSEDLKRMQEKVDRSVGDFMTEVERREEEETGEYRLPLEMEDTLRRKEKIERALKELEQSQQERVHLCEPEARLMKNRRCIDLSYNAQAVADEKKGIIVAAEVVNEGTDNGQLVPMLDVVKGNLGVVAGENIADGGYFSGSQSGVAAERGYEVLLNPSSSESSALGPSKRAIFHTKEFVYDEVRDCCMCPHGGELSYVRTRVRGKNRGAFRTYRCTKYGTCPYRSECTTGKRGREIEISVHHKALERQAAKREEPANRRLLSRRKIIIEPVFAWIKRHLGFERWTVAGLDKVRAQWNLICATINLLKVYANWKIGALGSMAR